MLNLLMQALTTSVISSLLSFVSGAFIDNINCCCHLSKKNINLLTFLLMFLSVGFGISGKLIEVKLQVCSGLQSHMGPTQVPHSCFNIFKFLLPAEPFTGQKFENLEKLKKFYPHCFQNRRVSCFSSCKSVTQSLMLIFKTVTLVQEVCITD